MLDGEDYMDDLGQSMPFEEFYKKMAEGADTKTSQVNVAEYIDYFTPFLKEGKDILHVTLSSGISGTVNSARNAAAMLAEEYPERKIYIVDSLGASSGYGLLMDALADKRDEGMIGSRQTSFICTTGSSQQTSASMSRAAEFQRRQASSERCSIYVLCLTWITSADLFPGKRSARRKRS